AGVNCLGRRPRAREHTKTGGLPVRLTEAIEAFMFGYFSTCRRCDKTQAAYRIDLRQLEAYLGADKPLLSIESDLLERWAKTLQSRGYASGSIRRKFATVRVFFTYWVRKGALEASPLWRIRLDLGRERLLPRNLP